MMPTITVRPRMAPRRIPGATVTALMRRPSGLRPSGHHPGRVIHPLPHAVPVIFGTEGLTCGRDGGSHVAPDAYSDDFAFTGTLKRVTMDLSDKLIADSENDIRIAMARQ